MIRSAKGIERERERDPLYLELHENGEDELQRKKKRRRKNLIAERLTKQSHQ